MQEGDFTLNKPGYYTVQNSEENDFLNDKLESDQYGIYYSVKFSGDAETYLWQAKTAPVEGEKYFGHIEQSKSGKSLRFKKDKVPEGQPNPSGQASHQADESIARAVALKAAVTFVNDEATTEFVLTVADDFLAWLKNGALASKPAKFNEPLPEFPGYEEEYDN